MGFTAGPATLPLMSALGMPTNTPAGCLQSIPPNTDPQKDRVPNHDQVDRIWAKVLYTENLFGTLFRAAHNLTELPQTTPNAA